MLGAVLALIALVSLILSHESFLLVILIPAGILACSLFRLEPSETGKFTPQWNEVCCYLTPFFGAVFLVFLTQWAMHSWVLMLSPVKLLLGIGIGGTFDSVALLAKKALLLPIDHQNEDPYYAAMEEELLTKINALGIGPQGFGGDTTALGLNILTAPTHIAGLPVAVNVNCHVSRHKEVIL